MKKLLLTAALFAGLTLSAQTAIQSVNSGSIITAGSSVSVGEIVVVPANPDEPQSGIIGIMAQVNNLQLEVGELELTPSMKVYPNPTAAQIIFEGSDLSGEEVSIFDNSGKLVSSTIISNDNSVDLSPLASGIYLIKIQNKQFSTFKIIKH